MTDIVSKTASGIANRNSRRGFLGRSGTFVLGIVGASTLAGAVAEQAHAADLCPCSSGNGCLTQYTCDCVGSRLAGHYACPSCEDVQCTYTRCTLITC